VVKFVLKLRKSPVQHGQKKFVTFLGPVTIKGRIPGRDPDPEWLIR